MDEARAVTNPQSTPGWIQPMDCLVDVCLDLTEQARFIPLHDSMARYEWFEAAAWLLAQVPVERQRVRWALVLANAINQCGLSPVLVLSELLRPREAAP